NMAATGEDQITRTFTAGADLSSYQYHFVKLSAGNIVPCDAAGEEALGVLQDAPTSGKVGTVCLMGRSKLKCGGNITQGAHIKTSTGAKAIAAVAGTVNTSDTGSASDAVVGSFVMGKALDGAADGDLIDALINPMGVIPTTAA